MLVPANADHLIPGIHGDVTSLTPAGKRRVSESQSVHTLYLPPLGQLTDHAKLGHLGFDIVIFSLTIPETYKVKYSPPFSFIMSWEASP